MMSLSVASSRAQSGRQANPERVTTGSACTAAVRSLRWGASDFLPRWAALSAANSISIGKVLLVASMFSHRKKVILVVWLLGGLMLRVYFVGQIILDIGQINNNTWSP